MRKIAMTMGVLGLLTLAADGMAELPRGATPPATPSAKPPAVIGTVPLKVAPTVHIIGFKRKSPAPYTGGPIIVGVMVENTGTSAATVQVHLGSGVDLKEQTVDLPAKLIREIFFEDTSGTDSGCSPRPYLLTLSGPAADTRDRHAKLVPTCTFSAAVTDPWNLATPDRVQDAQTNRLYSNNVAVEVVPTCSAGLKLKASVVNHAAKSGTSLILTARAGQNVMAQSIAFALPAGSGKEVVASGTPMDGVTGNIAVSLYDPTNNLTSSIVNQGVTIAVARSCSFTATIDP